MDFHGQDLKRGRPSTGQQVEAHMVLLKIQMDLAVGTLFFRRTAGAGEEEAM